MEDELLSLANDLIYNDEFNTHYTPESNGGWEHISIRHISGKLSYYIDRKYDGYADSYVFLSVFSEYAHNKEIHQWVKEIPTADMVMTVIHNCTEYKRLKLVEFTT